MSPDAFAALVDLLRIRDGKAQEAAMLVLVHGHRPGEAAALAGISPASASNCVARFRRGLKLAKVAVDLNR